MLQIFWNLQKNTQEKQRDEVYNEAYLELIQTATFCENSLRAKAINYFP